MLIIILLNILSCDLLIHYDIYVWTGGRTIFSGRAVPAVARYRKRMDLKRSVTASSQKRKDKGTACTQGNVTRHEQAEYGCKAHASAYRHMPRLKDPYGQAWTVKTWLMTNNLAIWRHQQRESTRVLKSCPIRVNIYQYKEFVLNKYRDNIIR